MWQVAARVAARTLVGSACTSAVDKAAGHNKVMIIIIIIIIIITIINNYNNNNDDDDDDDDDDNNINKNVYLASRHQVRAKTHKKNQPALVLWTRPL